jgi:threonine/homoserine/homoserine lactone efflux protein
MLRIAGSSYFLWLAWAIGRQAAPGTSSKVGATPIGFLAGLLLVWTNPKGRTMAISAAGSFAPLTDSPVALAAALAIVFGLGGAWLARTIHSELGCRTFNVTLAVLLVASIALLWR